MNLKQGTPQWFEARKRRLTSSNYGTLLGLNPYSGPREVAAIFHGQSTFTGNQACRYGSHHEDIAIKAYEKLCGVDVEETGLWVNKDMSEKTNFIDPHREEPLRKTFLESGMGGSPDGIIKVDGETRGIIEVKCPHSVLLPRFLDKTRYYIPQVQLNMFFTDTTRCDFINWTPVGLKVWSVARADTLVVTPRELIEKKAVSGADHVAHLKKLGLYDGKRVVGYKRIMVSILFSFFKRLHDPCPQWDRWEFEQREWVDLIVKVNDITVERAVPLGSTRKDFDMKEVPKKINWTCLLGWQLAADKRVGGARFEKFCVVEIKFYMINYYTKNCYSS